ncbi:hypothetical protein EB796_013006 [Bugula neritina]|uniref:Uncharacterized protein n=1 Tax=Bugula neritina TaxID=10212 RepID=A0A7J7JRV3_BUGNE|nr:hypothetical protein EB796_013006 [Bugula neritina]
MVSPGDESTNSKQTEGKTSVTDTSSCTAEQLNDQPKEEILSDSPKSAESSIGVHDSPLESYLSSGVEELMGVR